MNDAMDVLALNAMPRPVEPRTADGPVVSPDGTDRLWVPQPGVLLRVTTSPSLKEDIERIADGMRVLWNGDIDGLRVTYMPDGWRSPDEIRPHGDGIARSWSSGGTEGVTVEVVYGLRAKDLRSLQGVSWPTSEELIDVRRTSVAGLAAIDGQVVSRVGAAKTILDKGRMRLWVVRPGLGVRIWAWGDTAVDMHSIAERIEPIEPRFAESVDGLGLPSKWTKGVESQELGQRWRVTTQTWGARPGEGAYLAISVYRGQDMSSDEWPQPELMPWITDIPDATRERATVGGRSGTLLTWNQNWRVNGGPLQLWGKRFVWVPEIGLAVVVTIVANPLSSTAWPSLVGIDTVVRGLQTE